ncbi:hypothetical protein CAPTEDRAFT_136843 [Capitella teleta]|uniref:Mitochondrial GTPase 1 n=1 Tax=Capitella teleta TaxID=283909 RepID=R7TDP2_CAPTE|nr:hypothetical protein CAPTEDRAFT_136843 [Capitella teleta]|eukprot:ELT91632.1 hypothetical protein CAPTEDRAFT_136843 [Capitella teleta]
MPSPFRQSFKFVSKDVLHYFPGHMSRGLDRMQSKLKDIDLIIEVHDARIPLSCRNQQFKETLLIRPHLLIMNKIDVGDRRQFYHAKEVLKTQGDQYTIATNLAKGHNKIITQKIMPVALSILEDAPRYHRAEVDHYNMLVIGLPNVGKSTLINMWRKAQLGLGKATPAGAQAGVTMSVMEKIKVNDNPRIYLYDTPGIRPCNVADMHEGMKMALVGTIRDHLIGEDVIVDYLLYWLNKHEYFYYVIFYNMPDAVDNVYDFLGFVARSRGLNDSSSLLTGGYMFMPNYIRAANIVLSDFRTGKLGKFNLDEDLLRELRPRVFEETI